MSMMVIDNKFELGETVFLMTDPEQFPRIVTALSVNPNGIIYKLAQGVNESYHYDCEISREKALYTTL